MAGIVLEKIRKVYNDTVVAVDDMSMEIADGEIVSLLGPSGCGKTTTMRLIAGFEDADRGRIYIDGNDVTRWPPGKRNFSMVFQFPVVYDTMSIYNNIAAPLQSLKYPQEKIREVVRDMSASFEIDETLWNRKAAKLSISDRQRLSLAHAFAVKRNLYILDEPFSAIDPKARIRLTKYVRDVQQRKKHTLIFVTHSQVEALTLSDRIAVMKDGKLLQYGTPDDIYTKPSSRFVGWFLGNPGMNFLACTCRQQNGQLALEADSITVQSEIPANYRDKIKSEQEVILGIRPEHVELSKTQVPGYIPCTCRFAEPMGSRLLLSLEVTPEINVKAKVPIDINISVGQQAYLHLPAVKILLFDSKTERAL